MTGSFDNSAKLWDASSGKIIREFAGTAGHPSLILNVAFTPSGDAIATGGEADNFARIWDIPINSPVREFAALAGVNSVAVSADAKMVAGACTDGSVKLWTTADGKQVANLVGHPGGATGVAFAPTACWWRLRERMASCASGARPMEKRWDRLGHTPRRQRESR